MSEASDYVVVWYPQRGDFRYEEGPVVFGPLTLLEAERKRQGCWDTGDPSDFVGEHAGLLLFVGTATIENIDAFGGTSAGANLLFLHGIKP